MVMMFLLKWCLNWLQCFSYLYNILVQRPKKEGRKKKDRFLSLDVQLLELPRNLARVVTKFYNKNALKKGKISVYMAFCYVFRSGAKILGGGEG